MSEYYDLLTPKEKEVYCKIINNIEGKSRTEIAKEMFIAPCTLHTHLLNIYTKMGASSQIELIIKHYRERIKWKQYQQKNSVEQ